jgi:sugar phosphate isomerase/epimerase
MSLFTRRQFLGHTSVGVLATGYLAMSSSSRVDARPLDLPIGLQLYTMRDLLEKDFEGTLQKVGAIGYQEVELFGAQKLTAPELRKVLDAAKLKPISAHYLVNELQTGLDEKIAYAKALGLEYMVCPFPAVQDPSRLKASQADMFKAIVKDISLDDYRWCADIFNKVGEQTKKAGLQFAYHNHNLEFRNYGGVNAFDELLKRCDPDLVKIEMDCGWVVAAGHDPVTYLTKHPGRFPLLHIKDMKPGVATTEEIDATRTAEVGKGIIDWKKVFTAAKQNGLKHYFVEQDHVDGSPFDAIKTSCEFLQKLDV